MGAPSDLFRSLGLPKEMAQEVAADARTTEAESVSGGGGVTSRTYEYRKLSGGSASKKGMLMRALVNETNVVTPVKGNTGASELGYIGVCLSDDVEDGDDVEVAFSGEVTFWLGSSYFQDDLAAGMVLYPTSSGSDGNAGQAKITANIAMQAVGIITDTSPYSEDETVLGYVINLPYEVVVKIRKAIVTATSPAPENQVTLSIGDIKDGEVLHRLSNSVVGRVMTGRQYIEGNETIDLSKRHTEMLTLGARTHTLPNGQYEGQEHTFRNLGGTDVCRVFGTFLLGFGGSQANVGSNLLMSDTVDGNTVNASVRWSDSDGGWVVESWSLGLSSGVVDVGEEGE